MADRPIIEGNKDYQVWMEGHGAQGSSSTAEYLGTYNAYSFQHACVQACNAKGYNSLSTHRQGLGNSYYDPKRNTYWGMRFFDNEADARKSFG